MALRSIRARTTVVATAATFVTLAVASLLLLWALEDSLTESSDQAARARVTELAGRATSGRLPGQLPVGEDEMAQVVGPDGRVLAQSANLGDSPAVTTMQPEPGEVGLVVLTNVPDDTDVETFRVWGTTADGPDGRVRVYVGTSPERTREAVRATRGGLLVGVPAVAAALAALISWLVGRALAPVERVRAEVARISDSDLARRVPAPDSGDEIERLARTMNAMLERLEAGSRRQREFVADASHELLSPIASLRTQLEVAAAAPQLDQDRMLGDLTADTDRMERLVRDLLLLARDHEADVEDGWELVDLDEIVLAEARRLEPAGVAVDTSRVSAAPVRGRSPDLARLVRNLVENAAAHAGSLVTLTLTERDGTAELVVRDDGSGIPAELGERVFDRFVTGSAARRAGEGTGLGLAIARAVATRHQGTLTLDEGSGGAVFRLRLPSG